MSGLIVLIRRLRASLGGIGRSLPSASNHEPMIGTFQRPGPYVLVFCGPPCGGKTHLYDAFTKAHPEVGRGEMDVIRKTKLPGPINDEGARGAAYRLLHFDVSKQLRKGRAAVVNATYMPQRHRAELAQIALRAEAKLQHSVPMYVVQCVCSPETAVKRFPNRRLGEHAGTDLTMIRVKQLAEQYERFDGALLINTDTDPSVDECLSAVYQYINGSSPTDPIRWALHDYSRSPSKPTSALELGSGRPKRLSEASVRAAKRQRRWFRLGIRSIYAALLLSAVTPLKLAWIFFSTWGPRYSNIREHGNWLHAHTGAAWGTLTILATRSLHEVPLVEWVHFSTLCLAGAGLASIIVAYYHDTKERRQEAERWATAGKNPRFVLKPGDTRPPDRELFHAYQARLEPDRSTRMSIPDVPLFFRIPPGYGKSFGVEAAKGVEIPSELPEEAAKFGLDWEGFRLSQEEARQKAYPFAFSHEYGLRCVSLESPSDCALCKMHVTRSAYSDYTCTEHSVNLVSPGTLPDMRRLLEGATWDSGTLNLENIAESAKRYSMRISVTALVLTRDGYFVLQRRSPHVATGMGHLGATGSGAADYYADSADFHHLLQRGYGKAFAYLPWPRASHWVLRHLLCWPRPTRWNLRATALRETREEIGLYAKSFLSDKPWSDKLVPPFERPFLGAAYNLLYGRDLNFYCCFRTKLRSDQISIRRTRWLARDRWEVDNLVLLNEKKVTADAIERGELDKLLPNRSRHLLGALYAWAVYIGRDNNGGTPKA